MIYIFIESRYIPRDPSMNSETYHYKKGANQLFLQTSHIFDPTLYSEEDLIYNADKEVFATYIHMYMYIILNKIGIFKKKKTYFFKFVDYSDSYTLCSRGRIRRSKTISYNHSRG